MKKLVINQTLTGKLLEGFHEMDSGELIKFYGSDANRCGLYDEERHMAVIVSWNKPKLLGFLADERAAVKGAEARFRRNLQNYRHVDTLNATIAGRQAVGVRFEYNPDGTDIVQYGELYAFKHERVYYFMQVIGRKERFEEDQRLEDEFIRSVTVLP